jgi:NAD(P)-dependent dehydrogenase (short-subunit alcohol dehydrogenase family)
VTTFAPNLLAGKHAFITGGTRGINLSIAHRFASAGAKVTVIGRDAERAANAEQQLRDAGATALALTADVRDFAALDATIKKAVETHGAIDVLVCGAAGNFPAPAAAMSSNGFKAVVEIDLVGAFHACRAAFPHLTKPGACVTFISANQAYLPAMLQSHVCAAKAGVDMMMKALAMEWGGSGVRLNSIAPGPIADTEGMARLASTPEARSAAEKRVPLGRFGTKEEVAGVALFLASPAAAYITGAVIAMDGGFGLGGFGMNPLG